MEGILITICIIQKIFSAYYIHHFAIKITPHHSVYNWAFNNSSIVTQTWIKVWWWKYQCQSTLTLQYQTVNITASVRYIRTYKYEWIIDKHGIKIHVRRTCGYFEDYIYIYIYNMYRILNQYCLWLYTINTFYITQILKLLTPLSLFMYIWHFQKIWINLWWKVLKNSSHITIHIFPQNILILRAWTLLCYAFPQTFIHHNIYHVVEHRVAVSPNYQIFTGNRS